MRREERMSGVGGVEGVAVVGREEGWWLLKMRRNGMGSIVTLSLSLSSRQQHQRGLVQVILISSSFLSLSLSLTQTLTISSRYPHRLSVAAATSSPVLPLTFRCFYLATSYSLAGKRTEAYALYCRAHSLANDALKKFKSLTTADQVMIKKLKMLYDDSRSNSCIEHATGIRGGEGSGESLEKNLYDIINWS
ncbi:hypothetical protein TEA_007781 [Camellia sinensis var. sinensis]|uniref:Uncharacterized protein n=1 Tax=Camellia sinensis var. sinensis TaxID=542762 RepID=A0A4S4EFT0_CAMSN|nr:hypothetical protein TEA_007781 [Camellia sinensis var. sinensis]